MKFVGSYAYVDFHHRTRTCPSYPKKNSSCQLPFFSFRSYLCIRDSLKIVSHFFQPRISFNCSIPSFTPVTFSTSNPSAPIIYSNCSSVTTPKFTGFSIDINFIVTRTITSEYSPIASVVLISPPVSAIACIKEKNTTFPFSMTKTRSL